MCNCDELFCTGCEALAAQVSNAVLGYYVVNVVLAGGYDCAGCESAFNLADDLIEPYRAMVDLVAHILHNACMVDGVKVNVMSAIDMMVESLKRIMLDNSSEKLMLPIVLPVESMEGITE